MKTKIVNVVSTADLNQRVDLTKLNEYDWGRYDRDVYQAGYIGDGEIEGRVSVFYTGKIISSGGSSIKSSVQNLLHAEELMVKAGLIQKAVLRPRVRNIVATADLEHRLDLHGLARRMPNMIYEPDQFPGESSEQKENRFHS